MKTHDEEEQPASDGDEVEDAEQVVRRRVVRALLVVGVQAVQVRGDDPERERDREDHELVRVVNAVHAVAARAGKGERQAEAECEADDVGERKRPADEVAAAAPTAARAQALDDRKRALVEAGCYPLECLVSRQDVGGRRAHAETSRRARSLPTRF